jgi:hypothetical protein
MDNEEAVEDYVAAHPVPANYPSGGGGRLDTAYSSSDWDDTLKQLEKRRWIAPPKQPRASALATPKRRRKTSGRKT